MIIALHDIAGISRRVRFQKESGARDINHALFVAGRAGCQTQQIPHFKRGGQFIIKVLIITVQKGRLFNEGIRNTVDR